MLVGVGSLVTPQIDYNPANATDLAPAAIRGRISVMVLKNAQDMMRTQGQELARLMEPHKGNFVDTYA